MSTHPPAEEEPVGVAPDADGLIVDRPEPREGRRAPRVWFVDVVRLIASFQMINGHTLHAVMLDSLRQGALYEGYYWFRRAIPVCFLLVAGIAFHLSTLCRFERHRSRPEAIRRRYRRGVILIGVGYLLSFPAPDFDREAWERFFRVGILHTIGVVLLLLETLTVTARRAAHVVAASAVIAAFFLLAAPWAHEAGRAGAVPAYLGHWLSDREGSLFPLFPWAGFVFVGVVVGWLVKPQGGHTPFRTVWLRLFLVTAGTWLARLLAPLTPLAEADHRQEVSALAFNLERLGAVLGFLLLLAVACRPLRSLPRLLRVLSSESLAIFVVHLVLIYAWPFQLHLRVGRTLDLPRALLLVLVNGAVTIGLVWVWHRWKNGSLSALKLLRWGRG